MRVYHVLAQHPDFTHLRYFPGEHEKRTKRSLTEFKARCWEILTGSSGVEE